MTIIQPSLEIPFFISFTESIGRVVGWVARELKGFAALSVIVLLITLITSFLLSLEALALFLCVMTVMRNVMKAVVVRMFHT